jgi:hypothetical protein
MALVGEGFFDGLRLFFPLLFQSRPSKKKIVGAENRSFFNMNRGVFR